jgi:hypothetical protein
MILGLSNKAVSTASKGYEKTTDKNEWIRK